MTKYRQIRKAPPSLDATLLRQHVLKRLDEALSQQLGPGLYLVATPIGNLADVTLRAMSILFRADAVYCEDTRHGRQLLSFYGISRDLKPYHEHNADRERPHILQALANGATVALFSDAGTPLISDPGFKLVREAAAAGHHVISVPGTTAPIAALTCSGLPTDCFLFAGFLPPRQAARRTRLAELAAIPATLVFLETAPRLIETLADMADVFGAGREAAVARELTKLHEEVRRAPLGELASEARGIEPRGELVVLVGPPPPRKVDDDTIARALAPALNRMSLRDASREVAEALGVPRGRVYDLAVRMRRESP